MNRFFKIISVLFFTTVFTSAYAGQGWNIYLQNRSAGKVTLSTPYWNCWYIEGVNGFETGPGSYGSLVKTRFEENNGGSCNDLFFRVKEVQVDVTSVVDAFNSVTSTIKLSGGYRAGNVNCPNPSTRYRDIPYSNWVYHSYANYGDQDSCFYAMMDGSDYKLYIDIDPSGRANVINNFYPVYPFIKDNY